MEETTEVKNLEQEAILLEKDLIRDYNEGMEVKKIFDTLGWKIIKEKCFSDRITSCLHRAFNVRVSEAEGIKTKEDVRDERERIILIGKNTESILENIEGISKRADEIHRDNPEMFGKKSMTLDGADRR